MVTGPRKNLPTGASFKQMIDTTLSLGSLINFCVILVGFIYALGKLGQKSENMEGNVKEFFREFTEFRVEVRDEIKGIGEKLNQNVIFQTEITRLNDEVKRLRDWRHDTDTDIRHIKAKQEGFI